MAANRAPAPQQSDPTYDILRSQRQPLAALFQPRTVAVIGATERPGSVGRTLLWNLISHPFGGTVFPVNPKRHSVLGIRAYAAVGEIPEPVDLALIATPAAGVPDLVSACAAAGVKAVVVLSAGFREVGPAGLALEMELRERLRQSPMRLLGPNCLGLMNPRLGLNATFAGAMARQGHVGFLSQSGAICTAVLDWSQRQNVGFSAFVSMGSMLDVGWGDLITALGDDPDTHSIVIYMESIGDARAFMSAAREVALTKPIVVIKGGRTAEAAQAAASHTGALTGSDAVLEAAFRRCGVLRVDRLSDLFDLAEVLAKQPRRPAGPRLTIVTNAGGPGVLATDALVMTGGELAHLAPETLARLNERLPPQWSHGNPIDILGDADPQRYADTIAAVLDDPNSDGLLVVLTPQAMTDPTATAQRLRQLAATSQKPLVASWMGGDEVAAGEAILNGTGIATNRYPDAAARLFNTLWRYSYNLRGIYETPELLPEAESDGPGSGGPGERPRVRQILAEAQAQGRQQLSESEAKAILSAYAIPVVETRLASTAEQAVAAAGAIGYPVVVKLHSTTISHKSDVEGVQLNLQGPAEVEQAFLAMERRIGEGQGRAAFGGVTVQPMLRLQGAIELIVGSSVDPEFGPVILFGTGGTLVEVYRDSAVALPPLNTTLARRLMEQTKVYGALQGSRGRPAADLAELEKLLVRVSQLVLEQPLIRELDINPLLVSWTPGVQARTDAASAAEAPTEAPTTQLVALDARIVLADAAGDSCGLPRPAVRPYPSQYVKTWRLRDGTAVTIRPIRPEDEPLLVAFHRTLSEESVYYRYFHMMSLSSRITHERLVRICFTDYDREMALVVDRRDPESGRHTVLAVGRLSRSHASASAEFSLLVSDPYQSQGLGTELLGQLLRIGRDEGLAEVTAEILHENGAMQHVCQKLGFSLHGTPDVVEARISLLEPA
ncbi:bifunctional acetate--CoA ligase family protein/GNAT family N-acetyltransferase [Vulcanococcus limneticus Candia 3F8]|uniref:bifunctional acetate--CoA ligase family protein/GNAT family N-acetyltransferase n=1 Tax=Vulcanococcus limneticus TaxID=2170428 RepID=UPI000B991580|nr:bifunctional acetate--CoA ligase family protein/GNAT family N-acetyltransferase [Vulcanococcus limneticus]MCP9790930.1 bifunctional acetate--CoA ligase family protein/GNAT family N-acetyltransferase [Vulcanococcus limneticus MW73D5]MCP9894018.1 bifunctional acetate--CoA ligase family protein/GNAT family N-acetyltransferase [Vulcanococcus limneticus Candia 3F8]MCP9896024.1 bifunctional acetate--CoA ligase family protein/GNAT family N-acetyltransferase [Vulcanococcus limneticus Candia 3B3]